MLKKLLLVVAVVVVGFLAVVASRPAEFAIERSAVVNAPPDIAFAQVNDFHKWASWSPFSQMDPQMKVTYGGAATGVGSTYAWVGNSNAGEGKMEILEAKPGELVKIKLDFTKPMEANNTALFTFAKEGEGTRVTWRMEGKNNFLGKAFSMFMNMDKMVGAEFEKGLANMDTVAKAAQAEAVAAAAKAKADADKKAADDAAAAAQQQAAAPNP